MTDKEPPMTVKELAEWHLEVDSDVQFVCWIRYKEDDVLIDVYKNPEEAGKNREFDPLIFNPQEGLKLVDITEKEFKAVECGYLKLPENWSLDNCTKFYRDELKAKSRVERILEKDLP